MQASNVPAKSAVPFANSGTKNTIPVASQIGITPGAASFTDGFPPLTMTPLTAGGVPPYGADFNGILNFLSAGVRWAGAGGGYHYDADFSAAIGGYPKGAMLLMANGTGYWRSTADNNTANPDGGGANWVDATVGRLITAKTFISSGTYTPTAGTKFARFKGVAAGGGSGGTLATGTNQSAVSGAGSAGNHFDFFMFLDGIGSIPITIGAAGAAGTSAPTHGGSGGDILIGGYATIKGGRGGAAGNANQTFPSLGGACQSNEDSVISGAGTFGVLNGLGQTGVRGIALGVVTLVYSLGGNSAWGRGGTLDGGPGVGGGAVGVGIGQNSVATAGFPGGPGVLIIEEYA